MIKNKIKETMKLSISLTKKHVFLISLLALLIGIGIVGATWANSNGVGHDWDELKPCASGQILESTGSGWACGTDDVGQGGGGGIGGSGTAGTIPLFTAPDSIGDSILFGSGADVYVKDQNGNRVFSAYKLNAGQPSVQVLNKESSTPGSSGLHIQTQRGSADNYGLLITSGGGVGERFKVTGDGQVCINGDCRSGWSGMRCTTRVSSLNSNTVTIYCNADEYVTGGGGNCGALSMTKSYMGDQFTGGNPLGGSWTIQCSGTVNKAYVHAICCK